MSLGFRVEGTGLTGRVHTLARSFTGRVQDLGRGLGGLVRDRRRLVNRRPFLLVRSRWVP